MSNPVMKTRVTTKVMSSRPATVNVAAWKTVRAVVKMIMVLAVVKNVGIEGERYTKEAPADRRPTSEREPE